MHNRSIWRGVALSLLALAAATAIGFGAYNLGVEHALTVGQQAVELPAGAHPYPYYGGHGFFFFPFFGVLFLFVIARLIFWRSRWHRGGYCRHDGIPPAFEEWHRRAHAEDNHGRDPAGAPQAR
jgi:hypothetical protein